MKAWSARDKFKAGTNFRAWVLTIVRNQFYSDKRRSWRQAEWDQELAERTLPAVDNQEQIVALDELRRGLAELPDDQREALIRVLLEAVDEAARAGARGAGRELLQPQHDFCICLLKLNMTLFGERVGLQRDLSICFCTIQLRQYQCDAEINST